MSKAIQRIENFQRGRFPGDGVWVMLDAIKQDVQEDEAALATLTAGHNFAIAAKNEVIRIANEQLATSTARIAELEKQQWKDKCEIEQQDIDNATLRQQLAEAKAVIEKLPRTKDGAYVVPDDQVFSTEWDCPARIEVCPFDDLHIGRFKHRYPDDEEFPRFVACAYYYESDTGYGEDIVLKVGDCYSTSELAEAALAAQKGGG